MFNSRTFRLSFVISIVATVYFTAVWLYNSGSPNYNYARGYPGELIHKSFYHIENIDWGTFVWTVFFSAVFLVILSLIMWGLYALGRWILKGKRVRDDPCKDPRCPCARHEVERRDAEAARLAATVATAVAVSTVINS